MAITAATVGLTACPFACLAADPLPNESSTGQSASETGDDGQSIILNSQTFNIPFRVDAAGARPVQVQLYVARGEGSQWQLLDRQPPTVKEFQFAGGEDGVFWFATRTVDANGRAHPPGPIRAQLKVQVDTSEPKISLSGEADETGEIEVTVAVEDATAVRSVQIQYATDTNPKWTPLDPSSLDPGGRASFKPAGDWQQVFVHVVATDSAGNQSATNKKFRRPRVAAAATPHLASAGNGSDQSTRAAGYRTSPVGPGPVGPSPIGHFRGAAGPSLEGTSPASRGANSQTSVKVTPQGEFTAELPPPATAGNSNEFGLNPPAQHKPMAVEPDASDKTSGQASSSEEAAAKPKRPRSVAEALRPIDPQQPQPAPVPSNAPTSLAPHGRSLTSATQAAEPSEPEVRPQPSPERRPKIYRPQRVNTESIPLPENASVELSASEGDDSGRQAAARAAIDLAELQRRLPVRFSDSNRFSLDYELEAVGSRGVDAVELWGTVDAGATWKRWGTDPDRTSPFDIETVGEGVFGFRSVVVGRNGLVSPSPLDGDLPDILVVVDSTPPEVSLTSVRYGEGDRIGSLVIRYRCDDAYLLQRPIRLAFSDSLDGPWTTIAAGLENSGEYVWPADPELPQQLFLRIDATDQAGNVGSYVLDRPIDAQGLAPRAKIRGFRPLSINPSAGSDEQTAKRPASTLK